MFREDPDVEYAALATTDGRTIVNSAKHRAYEKFMDAVRIAGGRSPIGSDGYAQLWNEERGWFDRTETRAMSYSSESSSGPGWRVRFGALDGEHASRAAMTLYPEKLIIVDEAKLRQRDEDDLRESLLHELTHVSCGWREDCASSQLFHITLNEARSKCPRVIPAWTSTAW